MRELERAGAGLDAQARGLGTPIRQKRGFKGRKELRSRSFGRNTVPRDAKSSNRDAFIGRNSPTSPVNVVDLGFSPYQQQQLPSLIWGTSLEASFLPN